MKVKGPIQRRPKIEGNSTASVSASLRRSEIETLEDYAIKNTGGNITQAVSDAIRLLGKSARNHAVDYIEAGESKVSLEFISTVIMENMNIEDVGKCLFAWFDAKEIPPIRLNPKGQLLIDSLVAHLKEEGNFDSTYELAQETLHTLAGRYFFYKRVHADAYIYASGLLEYNEDTMDQITKDLIIRHLNSMIEMENRYVDAWLFNPQLYTKIVICAQKGFFAERCPQPNFFKGLRATFLAMNTRYEP